MSTLARVLSAFGFLPMLWRLRFRCYERTGDVLAWLYLHSFRRGVYLDGVAALASRCYLAARRVCEE